MTKTTNCPCKKCIKTVKQGVKSMKEEYASEHSIEDYVFDMLSGLWVECENCPDNDWERKD